MNKVTTYIAAAAIALSVSACSTTQLAEGAKATSQLISLEVDYNHAKGAIFANLDKFDESEQAKLRILMERADLLTEQLDNAWRTGDLSTASIDILFNEGRDIYIEARELVEPKFANMSTASKLKLKQIQASVAAIETSYVNVRDSVGERTEKAKLLWNSASLALKLALVAL